MILLDTNVVSEMMKAEMDPAPRRWIASQTVSELWLSAITIAELRYGALLVDGVRRAKLVEQIDLLVLEDFGGRIADFTLEASTPYAEIASDCRRAGKTMQPLDIQIAAICRLHRAPLATRNIRHFESSSIMLINPWDA